MQNAHKRPTTAMPSEAYNPYMSNLPDHLERYLAICQQVYERMKREGSWPWPEEPDINVHGDSLGDTVSP